MKYLVNNLKPEIVQDSAIEVRSPEIFEYYYRRKKRLWFRNQSGEKISFELEEIPDQLKSLKRGDKKILQIEWKTSEAVFNPVIEGNRNLGITRINLQRLDPQTASRKSH